MSVEAGFRILILYFGFIKASEEGGREGGRVKHTWLVFNLNEVWILPIESGAIELGLCLS